MQQEKTRWGNIMDASACYDHRGCTDDGSFYSQGAIIPVKAMYIFG